MRDGGFGQFLHRREMMGIDDQFVVRGNRDTLYSIGVFDLDAGPVTVTMPDAGNRFMALQIIDEDQYVPDVFYGAGSHTLTRVEIGTRYVGTAVRTLVDPDDPEDEAKATALQDAITVEQPGGPGVFEMRASGTSGEASILQMERAQRAPQESVAIAGKTWRVSEKICRGAARIRRGAGFFRRGAR